MGRDVLADAAEEQPLDAADPTVADDHEVGGVSPGDLHERVLRSAHRHLEDGMDASTVNGPL